MHLVELNSTLDELDVHAYQVSCSEEDDETNGEDLPQDAMEDESEYKTVSESEAEADDELDERGEGLYLCRWPNGEFSVVKAESKRDALVQLDEWAGAEPSWLVQLGTFMADFRLDNSGDIEFNQFGEETNGFIREHCYPELEAVLASDAVTSLSGDYSAAEKEVIKKAVEHERKRLWDSQREGAPAKTELGKRLQKTMGTTGAVADAYVKFAGERILESDAGEGGKPN
jgi:hypothetical protein